MPNDEHVVFLAECDIAIRRGEIVFVRRGMDQAPLQNIFRRNGIELRDDERRHSRVLFKDVTPVERRANHENVFESFLQRRLRLRSR